MSDPALPAIQLARLKIQAGELALKATTPADFRRAFHDLLDYYADRTYRPGKAGEPPPLMQSYHVPPPVLKQVLSALQPMVTTDEKAVLALGDMLWLEPNYEFRLLAASLLGQVSVDKPEPVLERFTAWARPGIERRLVRVLIEHGLARLRQEHRDRYLEEAADRLKSESVFVQQLGLVCLELLVNTKDFEDYPAITRLLAPLLRNGSTSLRPELLRLIQGLVKKSPKETGFFLRQNLVHRQDNLNTTWLIRHSMADFPVETQEYLREGLREGT